MAIQTKPINPILPVTRDVRRGKPLAREIPPVSRSLGLQLADHFGSHMVLQAEQPIRIWGMTVPQDQVEVRIDSCKSKAVADANGRFDLELPAMRAGGPFELTVSGAGGSVVLEDVMLGEVWLCCGQSNMVWPVKSSTGAQEILRSAIQPDIRLLVLPGTEGFPRDAKPAWKRCTSQEVATFSAVAYLYGKELQQNLNRPVGLVLGAVGGSHVQAWMSREALLDCPASRQDLLDFDACCNGDFSVFSPPPVPPRLSWASPKLDDSSWSFMDLPATWQDEGHFHHGVLWFRRKFEISPEWAGKKLMLSLGRCSDEDRAYVNGKLIGSTPAGRPGTQPSMRLYDLPVDVVRPGINTLAVRVSGHREGCGMIGPSEAMQIHCPQLPHASPISLVGPWKYRVQSKQPMKRVVVHGWLSNRNAAAHALFDSIIAPLIPLPIRGVLWYQGEQNAWQAAQYGQLFLQLIRDWRKRWGRQDLSFAFVQIPNAQARRENPTDSDKAELREAQAAVLSEPCTAMAVTIDCGGVDLHPREKRQVAHRLANAVLATVYGRNINWRGPRYLDHRVEGSTVFVNFTVDAGPLKTKDRRAVVGFALAGEDQKFHWASGTIEGSSVILHCPAVPHPVAIRYAWANNPDCNLCDSTGLPAEPFRTDKWPSLTQRLV